MGVPFVQGTGGNARLSLFFLTLGVERRSREGRDPMREKRAREAERVPRAVPIVR